MTGMPSCNVACTRGLVGPRATGAYMGARVHRRIKLATRARAARACCTARRRGADEDMTWKRYGAALLVFNVFGFLVVYGLQRLQASLPLNPDGLAAVSPEVSFNTAVSFTTNTNWQSYGGETTMSYLTQMLGLTVQNFVSAATGMAVLVALIRGFSRRSAPLGQLLGRMTAAPHIYSALIVLSGVWCRKRRQTLGAHETAALLDSPSKRWPRGHRANAGARPGGFADRDQATRTNGGGFFNVNRRIRSRTRRPVELLEMLALLLIPPACASRSARWQGQAPSWAS